MTDKIKFLHLCIINAKRLQTIIHSDFKVSNRYGNGNYSDLKRQGLCIAIKETAFELDIFSKKRSAIQDHFIHWLQQWAFWRGLSDVESRYPLNQNADQFHTFAKQGRLYQGDQLKLRLHCLNLYIQHLETMINENKNQDNEIPHML